MSKKTKFPKVSERVIPGTIQKSNLSGPVNVYHLSREEIEKQYGPVGPKVPTFCKGWPTSGKPNTRHIAKRLSAEEDPQFEEEIFTEEDYIDPEWGLQEKLDKLIKF
jgi:hypothetical protein